MEMRPKSEPAREYSGVPFGSYQLLEPIGKGGMAEVWRGKLIGAQAFERVVVIKRILPHLCGDPRFVEMFITEARLSARLHHPNIVQVFELGDVAGELFLVLEHVAGVDLLTLLRATAARGPLPLGLAAHVIHGVARALGFAYDVQGADGAPLRIVHRDVSPSNVMVGYDGQVKLLDFGVAKALGATSDERTRSGTLKGKIAYLAPEFIEGAPFDHRSDLFAAGVMLHELLTGRRLFKGDGDFETLRLIRDGVVAPPSRTNPAVPPALDAIAMKLLARDPAARYQHAGELVVDLGRALHDLRWGATETAAAVLESAPPREASAAGVTAAGGGWARLERARGATGAARRAPRRRIWPLVVAIAAAVALVGGAAWVVAQRGHKAERAAKSGGVRATAPVARTVPVPGIATLPVPATVSVSGTASTVAKSQTAKRAKASGARRSGKSAHSAADERRRTKAKRNGAPLNLDRGDVVDSF
jgi:hypothetical protein